ncbi:MAG: hypothetical protein OSJ83_12675, partial [Clostridia bacterium]|nr:hypothetical protein [Clostridia bacterium]
EASVGTTGLDVVAWASRVGGYAVFAVIATAVLLPLDFMFTVFSDVVSKRLPIISERKKPPVGADAVAPEKTTAPESEYDIFGYEITEKGGERKDGENKDKDK